MLATAGARWIKKGGESVFGYKQHTLVDIDGFVIAVETAAANQNGSIHSFKSSMGLDILESDTCLCETRPVPDGVVQLPEPCEGSVFDDGFVQGYLV